MLERYGPASPSLYPSVVSNRRRAMRSEVRALRPKSTWIRKWEMPIRQEPGNRRETPDRAVGSLGHLGYLTRSEEGDLYHL